MIPNLPRYLNKTVLVSIPSLFEDGVCRPYKLLGAEMNGLWLQSDELTQRLLPDDSQYPACTTFAVFVPLAQIAGVLIATAIPIEPPTVLNQETPPAASEDASGSEPTPENTSDDKPIP